MTKAGCLATASFTRALDHEGFEDPLHFGRSARRRLFRPARHVASRGTGHPERRPIPTKGLAPCRIALTGATGSSGRTPAEQFGQPRAPRRGAPTSDVDGAL